jgi:hypothetical protein
MKNESLNPQNLHLSFFKVIPVPIVYLLLNTNEYDPQMLKDLRGLTGVENAYALYGVHDIIVKTKTDNMKKTKAVHDKIRKMKNIKSTLTLIEHEE